MKIGGETMNNTVQHVEKDNFSNNEFSAKEWSAPTLSNPDEIKTRIASFKLEGRKIKRMKFIGLSYYHTRDWISQYTLPLGDKAVESLHRRPNGRSD